MHRAWPEGRAKPEPRSCRDRSAPTDRPGRRPIWCSQSSLCPLRVEHEVVDDELTATVEEGVEGSFPVRSVEGIGFLDLHHRKPASLGVYAVELFGEFLFMCQKFLSFDAPLVARNDWRMRDCACRHL